MAETDGDALSPAPTDESTETEQDGPERTTLGTARLFTNDALGDGKDRWRTGSSHFSLFRGPEGGDVPDRPGAILEYRFRTEIVTARDVASPAPDDRRHAGTLEFGLAAPFRRRGWEGSVGAAAILMGPQTGLGQAQVAVHEALGLPEPDLSGQLGNAAFATGRAEVARRYALPRGTLRPYADVQLGFESFARAGADVIFGAREDSTLMTRDYTTGTLLPVGEGAAGLSLLMGADIAYLADSALLPSDTGPEV
ncbi:MAG: lipid A-modifier LpxR family protein, partial [Shimia sp.]